MKQRGEGFMQFGIVMFPTDYAINIIELGRAAEDLGFESLWVPEHTHIPADRRSPYPGGGELPREYSHTLDPFVALAAVAAATTTLRLGTGVCLVVERDPITLAKEVASLDFVSGGRFLFGVGGGWNREEMQNHGTAYARRWRLLRERILAMKQIWTEDAAEYHGEMVKFDPIWQWPKPTQRPHPPVIVGGSGPRTLERVLEYGDGWMPIVGRDGAAFAERIAELQRLAQDAGRGSIPVSAFGAPANAAMIAGLQAIGVERCIFWLPPLPAEETLPRLKHHADLIRQLA
jgi:probable F420-dependent oxidoreductase